MQVDSANRSFATLFGASLMAGMFVLCGAVGCVLVGLVVAEVASDGIGSLSESGRWTAAVFVAVVGVGAGVGLRSFVLQLAASRRLARRVGELGLPSDARVVAAAKRTGMRRDVALVDCDEPFSFAHGALTPRVVVSRGLVEQATHDELAAVLEHERYHVRNLDPLKVLFARALPPTFFYLPALRLFEQRYVAGRELAADRLAVGRCVASHSPAPWSKWCAAHSGPSCASQRRSAGRSYSTRASASSRPVQSRASLSSRRPRPRQHLPPRCS